MKFIKSKQFIIIIISILVIISIFIFTPKDEDEERNLSGPCNVMRIFIRGDLKVYSTFSSLDKDGEPIDTDETSSEDILSVIDSLKNNSDIKAIFVVVDSYGGEIIAGEEISSYLKQSGIPVIALIRSAGVSSAYYAISGSKKIFASELSDVGSIGVTLSRLNNAKKNEKEGLTFIEASSGKFKDTFNPDKQVTQEELVYVKDQIKTAYDKFVKDVSINRNIPIDEVFALADGSSVMGVKAKELGLIDEIGDYYDAVAYTSKLIGENINFCE